VELDASVDEKGRRVQVADDLARRIHLDRGLGANVPIHDPATHNHGGDVDFGVNFGALADDEGIFTPNLALEDAVDPDAPFEMELALELGAAPQEGGNLGGRQLLLHRPGLSGSGVEGQLQTAIAVTALTGRVLPLAICNAIFACYSDRYRGNARCNAARIDNACKDSENGSETGKSAVAQAGARKVRRLRYLVLLVGMLGATLVVRGAAAQSVERLKDQPTSGPGVEAVPSGDQDPFRGSTFLFDQSITTSTAGVGFVTPQSYVPFYGWWLSFRPRWNFSSKLRLQLRADYYKEFTNSQQTTNRDEDVFGDIWTDLVYQTPLATEGAWKNTKVSAGARVLWPTSKISQAAGIYATVGATLGVSQKIPLRGPDAPTFNSARVGLSLAYLHSFSDSTTPNSPGFSYTRENVDGYSFVSNQLSGQTLSEHTLYAIVDTGLDITPKLSVTLDAIFIWQWHYPPSDAAVYIANATAPVVPSRNGDQQRIDLTWLVLSVDYEVMPELSVGLGYYNLANDLSADSQRRGVFDGGQHSFLWSPDAHIFLDLTANLDRLYEDASGKYTSTPRGETASAARAARESRVASDR